MPEEENPKKSKSTSSYTIKDAVKVADDIFKLTQDKKYNLGAFIHGLIFALEYAQYSYGIPPKQMAEIKRDCRKYFKEIDSFHQPKK